MWDISIKLEAYSVTTDIITSDSSQIGEAEFSVSNKTGPCSQHTNRSLPEKGVGNSSKDIPPLLVAVRSTGCLTETDLIKPPIPIEGTDGLLILILFFINAKH